MNWLGKYLPLDASGSFDFNEYLNRGANGEHIVWMPIAIFVCILAMWGICKFVRNLHKNYWYDSDSLLQGGMMVINAVLVVVTNLLIIIYVLSTGPAALWFMYPTENGSWTRTVICGIAYLYCVINLLVAFLKTMDDFSGELDGRINCKWGLVTLAIGIIALVGCAMSKREYITLVLIAIAICQFIQLGMILYKSIGKGILTALASCCIYAICSVGLLIFAAPFILLLIILAVVLLISAFSVRKMMEDVNQREVLVYDDGRIVDKYNSTEYKQNTDGTISKKY